MVFKVKNIGGTIEGVILLAVFLLILPSLVPLITQGFTNISNIAGNPFASFFASGGAMYMVLFAAILLVILGIFKFGGSKR